MPTLGSVTVIGWADNLPFMTRTLALAQKALNVFTQGLHEMGMRWMATSKEYLHEGAPTSPGASSKRQAAKDDPEVATTRPTSCLMSLHALVLIAIHWINDSRRSTTSQHAPIERPGAHVMTTSTYKMCLMTIVIS